MLSAPLELGKIEADKIIDALYVIFHRDFIANKTYLAKIIYIDPRRKNKDDGKERDFWHLTTREIKEKIWVNNKAVWEVVDRVPDFARSERLEWVKQILTNHNHDCIKMFYHKETNKNRSIRLYLWAYEHDFVVILQKLGRSSSFLVTSFYIDHAGKRDDYNDRYNTYIRGSNHALSGCEWF